MLWSEFSPYVLPYVIGCPEPLLVQHVKLAAIEFCRRTACLQRTLDPLTTDGSTLLELEPDAGMQISRVHAVTVNAEPFKLVDAKYGLTLARSNSPEQFCFTQDNHNLQIYPVPKSGLTVLVDAVLIPTLSSTTLDGQLEGDFLQDIAPGAVASLQRVPDQKFTDMNASAVFQAQFQARISTIAAKVSRGLMTAKLRSFTSFI